MSVQVYSITNVISVGTILYTDVNLTNPAPNGVYSNGVDAFYVSGGSGQVTSITASACTPTTTTTTTTTTEQQIPTIFENYDVSTTELEVCSAPVGLILYSFVPFATGVTLYSNNTLPLTPLTGYNFIKMPPSGTIYTINSSTGVVGSPTGNTC